MSPPMVSLYLAMRFACSIGRIGLSCPTSLQSQDVVPMASIHISRADPSLSSGVAGAEVRLTLNASSFGLIPILQA